MYGERDAGGAGLTDLRGLPGRWCGKCGRWCYELLQKGFEAKVGKICHRQQMGLEVGDFERVVGLWLWINVLVFGTCTFMLYIIKSLAYESMQLSYWKVSMRMTSLPSYYSLVFNLAYYTVLYTLFMELMLIYCYKLN